jgi:hypothetical protein
MNVQKAMRSRLLCKELKEHLYICRICLGLQQANIVDKYDRGLSLLQVVTYPAAGTALAVTWGGSFCLILACISMEY